MTDFAATPISVWQMMQAIGPGAVSGEYEIFYVARSEGDGFVLDHIRVVTKETKGLGEQVKIYLDKEPERVEAKRTKIVEVVKEVDVYKDGYLMNEHDERCELWALYEHDLMEQHIRMEQQIREDNIDDEPEDDNYEYEREREERNLYSSDWEDYSNSMGGVGSSWSED